MMSSPSVQQFIQALADKKGGKISPRDVVNAARPEESPIHSRFTWDDAEAAEKCREDEARALIRSVKVIVTTTQFTVNAPAFLRDPAAGAGQGYVSIGKLQTDEDLAREAVISEFARASAALARAKVVALALGLSDEIEEVHGRVMRLADKMQQEEGDSP